MFVCKECVTGYEGPAIDWAVDMNRCSLGCCELCERGGRACYDIPSGAAWRLKPKAKRRKKNA